MRERVESENAMAELESAIGYKFKSISLLTLAMTHRSFSKDNNERLEFLGDRVLGLILSEFIFKTFPEAKEGILDNYFQKFANQENLYNYAKKAENNNFSAIIAGAGGSAHLPGMIAAITRIPVIGVPIESKKLKGLDSLLSIAQMPKGIPVGTVAIGEDGAINAGLFAASIIATYDDKIKKSLLSYRKKQTSKVRKKPK